MDKVITKIAEENNVFGDGIAYAYQYDFSRANLNDTTRIEAITTVASVCYDNPNIVGKESLYNRLKAESMGLPSSSFEFVPILLNEDDLNDIVHEALRVYDDEKGYVLPFILDVEKYGEWIEEEDENFLLTNYRALLSDHEKFKHQDDYRDITQYYNTEAECEIIAKYAKTFLYKMDLSTSKQHNRHRVSLQEMCLTGDSVIKTSQGKRTIKELYNNQFRKSSNKLPKIKTYDFKDDVFKQTEIKEVFDTGVKEVFEVIIQYGSEGKTHKIKTSKDHKFLTADGWKRLEDIELKSFVAINGELKHKNEDFLRELQPKMIKHKIRVEEWAKELKCNERTLKKYLKKYNLYYTHNDFEKPLYQNKEWLLKTKKELLERGIGQKGFAKIYDINYNTLKKWMHHHEIYYAPLEVSSTFEVWNKGIVGEESHSYGVKLTDETRQKISDKLVYDIGTTKSGFGQRMRSYWEADFRRQKVFDNYNGRCAECGTEEKIEYDHILPVSRYPEKGFDYNNMQLLCKDCHRIKSNSENKYGTETYKYGMIVSINSCGEQQTYDLEVEHEDHNYIANNIVVHNSRRYVSGKKTKFEFYISDGMKDIVTLNEYVESPDDIIDGQYSTKDLNDLMVNHYFEALKNGVQPQEARRILPQSMYTVIWSNFLPFQLENYLNLRDDSHAQNEIKWLAQAMKRLLKKQYANN